VFLPAYVVNERTYLAGTPTFFWSAQPHPLQYANPEFERYYNVYVKGNWLSGRVRGLASLCRKVFQNFLAAAYLFLWPELLAPLAALPWILRNRKGRFLFCQVALVFGALLASAWFAPHYLAPLTASLFALLVAGIRFLRLWRVRGRPCGIALSRAVVILTVLLAPFGYQAEWRFGTLPGIAYRAAFIRQLDHLPGRHLVIVHYTPEHNVLREWVYNDADIDQSKVVWAREIPGRDLKPLLSWFPERRVWLAEPDASPPRLTPYPVTSP
jgi:hypothetical protein